MNTNKLYWYDELNSIKYNLQINTIENFEKKNTTINSHVNNTKFIVPHTKWSTDFIQRTKTHELKTNKKLLELLLSCPENEYIIDAGSHIGDTGLLMANELKVKNIKSKIIEIDPDKTKISFINEMTKLNKLTNYISTHILGLSNNKTKGSLNKTLHPGGWYIKKGSDFTIDKLDNVIKSKTYLIKLDVEGNELNALIGAINIIKQDSPLLFIEVCDKQLKRYGHSTKMLYDFLKKNNYKEVWYDDTRDRSNTDVLFKKN